jgi:hypothetical protein
MYEPGHYASVCRDYARHVTRVNAEGWKKWTAPARPSTRARIGAFLIALGTRLAPAVPASERLSGTRISAPLPGA